MMNRLTKKIAYVLCISSLMSLTTVESMPEDNKNPEHGGDGKNIVQDDKNPEQDDNSKNIAQDDKTPKQNSYEIENGILGVNRDIFLMLSGMLFERQLSNMIGFSGESTKWLNHRNYTICRNCDRVLFERLCKSLTRWKHILPSGDFGDFHMVSNGKTIIIVNSWRIYLSEDGEIYKRTNGLSSGTVNGIYDVIVADGKYIATTGYSLFTSDSCKKWKKHDCPKYIVKMAYDERNKMYYGISQDDYRHNVYASKDITKLGTHSSEIAANLPDDSLFYTCCGNGMFVVSLVGRKENYYLNGNSLERSALKGIIFDMSYNPQSKLIVAITKPSIESTAWNIYTTKDAYHWKKELESKKLDTYMFESFNKKAAIITIAGYSVVLMQSRDDLHILIRKKNREWTEMKEEISGIGLRSQIRKFIGTKHGIFMLTDKGIIKAVGNIKSNSEDDVDSKIKSLWNIKSDSDSDSNSEDNIDYEDVRMPAVNPANTENTENTAIVKYEPNISEMKNVPYDDNILLKKLSQLLANWEDVQLGNEAKWSHIVSNGKTIVVAGYNGISYSIDGKAYDNVNNHNIKDIMVADGKYVAISSDSSSRMLERSNILTSDDGIQWNNCKKNNHNITSLAYDDVNKMYYGIGRARIYANKNITKLGNSDGKRIAYASSFSFYTCCGNGIFVASNKNRIYYLYKGSLQRSHLYERVMGMSYNPQSKRILAVTKPESTSSNSDLVSWNIHSTKDGNYWEKELNTKDNFNIESKYKSYLDDLDDDDKPFLTTIDGYSILFIKKPINILIRKNDGKWIKISEIIGIAPDSRINQIFKIDNGIFMPTYNGIKKAVGGIMPMLVESNKVEHDVDSDSNSVNPKHRLRRRDEYKPYVLSHEKRELSVLNERYNKHRNSRDPSPSMPKPDSETETGYSDSDSDSKTETDSED